MIDTLSATIPTVGLALLHSLWQGGLVALFTYMILRVCRDVRWRYFWSCSALMLCLILPLYFVLNASFNMNLDAHFELGGTNWFAMPESQSVSDMQPASMHIAPSLNSAVLHAYLPWLVSFWALGVAAMCLRMALGLRWVRGQLRLSEAANTPDNAAQLMYWQTKLKTLAERATLPAYVLQHLRLGISTVLESPVTAGCWRPVVLLPSALLTGMPPELIEALLAHEVAHIKRMDYLVNLLQSAIEIVLFYHPAVWWLSKQIRSEREQIADDLAAGLLGEPRRLALALSELERFQFTTPQLAQAAHGGNLMFRIQRLIRPELAHAKFSPHIVVKTLLAACGLLTASTVIYVQAQTVVAPANSAKAAAAATQSAQTHALQKSVQKTAQASSEKVSRRVHSNTTYGTSVDDDEITITENNRRYVIKDPQLVQQAKNATKVVEELSAQMEEQGKKMEDQGQIMEEIGRQMEAITPPETKFDADLEKKLVVYEKKMAAYEKKLERALERREAATGKRTEAALQETERMLQKQMRELAEVMKNLAQSNHANEQKIRDAMAPMEQLSKKMSEASAPMEKLSAEMEVLSKKMEIVSAEVEKRLKEIIATAKQAHLLIPIEKS